MRIGRGGGIQRRAAKGDEEKVSTGRKEMELLPKTNKGLDQIPILVNDITRHGGSF